MKTATTVLLLALVCGASVSSVVAAEECGVACPMEMAPVCGTDRRPYGNACLLELAGCQLRKTTNGKSTIAVDKTLAYNMDEDACVPTKATSSCGVECTQDVYEQCGSDGKTYRNACDFKDAQCKDPTLTYVALGACPKTI